MKIPDPLNTVEALINKAHEDAQEPPRPHLGCSLLGHPCDRFLWLTLRWAVVEKHTGRLLRLFRRGQLEEETILQDLRRIGVFIQSRQTHVDFGSHVSGSTDGDLPQGYLDKKRPAVLECKTHSKKSFDELVKKKVQAAKPMHYTQMQVYMLGRKYDRALYYAVCKDDDRIYTERVRLDEQHAIKAIERGKKIALCERMPEPISSDPSWYQCKMCSMHEFCHETQLTKQVNCRTCCHVTPTADSTWTCARNENESIPVQFQRSGCDQHVLHPDLVPWKLAPNDNPNEATYVINDVHVRNGEPDAFVYSSKEIIADPIACTIQDETVELLRANLGGRIQEPEINF